MTAFLNITYLKAGVQADLGKFFDKLGSQTNVTESGVYQDQAAGYYTGGNLFARNTVHTAQLASIRLPGYRAGCGGIDMHLGAFSFISSQELINAFRAIGSNMASYALMLGIETLSPQIKNIITELNDLAQKINQSNINSCEIAATTLGSILPKSDAANRHLCTMIGSDRQYGGFSDHAAARQGCGPGGKQEEVLKRGENDPRFKKMLGSEFNLSWKALQENEFLRSDSQLAEFFMTISGTVISYKTNDGHMITSKPSLADKNSLLTALLFGGTATIYSCRNNNDGKCLEIEEKLMTISPDQAFVTKVKKILISIQNKIYADEALNASEQAFLNSTRLPFYKIINVATAYRRGSSPIDLMEYSELGAIDILFQYLIEIIDVINESASHIKSVQVDDTQIRKFQEGLNNARARVMERRMGTFKHVEQMMSMVHKTEIMEKALASRLSMLSTQGL